MIVKPKLRTPIEKVDGELLDQPEVWHDIPSKVTDGLYVECEAVHPPSSVGKKVTVWIPPEDVAAAFRTIKEFAIRQRKGTLNADA